MSASTVTMEELELERAELPQVGYGNTAQSGVLNLSAGNGSFDNILSLGSGNIW
jgi:hypothetical protein